MSEHRHEASIPTRDSDDKKCPPNGVFPKCFQQLVARKLFPKGLSCKKLGALRSSLEKRKNAEEKGVSNDHGTIRDPVLVAGSRSCSSSPPDSLHRQEQHSHSRTTHPHSRQ